MADQNEMRKIVSSQIDAKTAAKWAADCADRVLRQFEDQQGQDDRPRKAIAACRSWIKEELVVNDVKRYARDAHAAARDAETRAAIAAARAAGHAAASTHVPEHAAHAAEYARKAIQYYTEDDQAVQKERIWQINHLNKLAGK